jgi:hypothetical protein
MLTMDFLGRFAQGNPGSRIPRRLGLPGRGPRVKGELCRSTPVDLTASGFAS